MNRQQILERERNGARYAGLTALAVPIAFIASTALVAQISLPDGLATDQFRGFDENSSTFLFSSILRAIAVGLMAVPLFYLFRAAQARSPRVNRVMVGFAVLPPALLAVQSLLSYVAQKQLASDFLAAAGPGGDIYTLFDDLLNDSSLLLASQTIGQTAGLALVIAMVYIPLQAMRVGLLTRFVATLGIALGVASILVPQLTLLPLAIWFGWLGFTFLDRVPRGRPPAWAAGEAIPWPRPGDQVAEPPAAVLEGDATEVFEPAEPADHSARRERARKRKRKRRR